MRTLPESQAKSPDRRVTPGAVCCSRDERGQRLWGRLRSRSWWIGHPHRRVLIHTSSALAVRVIPPAVRVALNGHTARVE